uniref:Uncharacterized protein n=1 Tax=Acrobeloides nanus TaxID=290746 RepID=A0A914DL60_9BILA
MRHLRDRHHEAYEEVVRAERKRKAIIKIRGRSSRGCKQDYLEPLVESDLLDDEEGATLKSIASLTSTSGIVSSPSAATGKHIIALCERTGCFVQLPLNEHGYIPMCLVKDHLLEAKGLKMRQGKARQYLVVLPDHNGILLPPGGFDLYFDFKIHYQQEASTSQQSLLQPEFTPSMISKLPKGNELLEKYLVATQELGIMRERCISARRAEMKAKNDLILLRQTLDEYQEKIRQLEYKLEMKMTKNERAIETPFNKDRYPTLIQHLESKLEEQKLKNSILETKRNLEFFANSYQIKYPGSINIPYKDDGEDDEDLTKLVCEESSLKSSLSSPTTSTVLQSLKDKAVKEDRQQTKTVETISKQMEDGTIRRVFRIMKTTQPPPVKTEPESDHEEVSEFDLSQDPQKAIKQELDE